MTRQHFQALADMVRELEHHGQPLEVRALVAWELLRVCKRFNGRASGARFFARCGFPEGVAEALDHAAMVYTWPSPEHVAQALGAVPVELTTVEPHPRSRPSALAELVQGALG